MNNKDLILNMLYNDDPEQDIKLYNKLYGSAPTLAVELENDADQLKIAQLKQESHKEAGATLNQIDYFKCKKLR